MSAPIMNNNVNTPTTSDAWEPTVHLLKSQDIEQGPVKPAPVPTRFTWKFILSSILAVSLLMIITMAATWAYFSSVQHNKVAESYTGAPAVNSSEIFDSSKSSGGSLTYYWVNDGQGTACQGKQYSNNARVVAVAMGLGYRCGHTVKISANGHSTTAIVVDKCQSCGNSHLDAAPGVWQGLGFSSWQMEQKGEIGISYYFM